jgi:hypothetical protein
VTTHSLLSTLEGGDKLALTLSNYIDQLSTLQRTCLVICQSLQVLPSDGGWFAAAFQKQPLTSIGNHLEATLLMLCRHAATGALSKEFAQADAANRAQDAASQLELCQKADDAANALEKQSKATERRRRQQAARSGRKQKQLVCQASAKSPIVQDNGEETSSDGEDSEAQAASILVADTSSSNSGVQRSSFAFLDNDIASIELALEMATDPNTRTIRAKQSEHVQAVSSKLSLPERVWTGPRRTIVGHVVALTDHPKQPLYCFIVLVAVSDSMKDRKGLLVRPVPHTCVTRDDEMGRFWVKKKGVPEFGSMVELKFFEEDTREYLRCGQCKYPQQNEDLLCETLNLKGGGDLMQEPIALRSLTNGLISERVKGLTKLRWGSMRGLGLAHRVAVV